MGESLIRRPTAPVRKIAATKMTSSPMRRPRLRCAGNLNAETGLSPVLLTAASLAARSEPVPARSEPVAFFPGEVSGGSGLLGIGLFHDRNHEDKNRRALVVMNAGC